MHFKGVSVTVKAPKNHGVRASAEASHSLRQDEEEGEENDTEDKQDMGTKKSSFSPETFTWSPNRTMALP